MKIPSDLINKKEDFFLEISATNSEGFVIENLKCKSFLPEKQTDYVWLLLYLTPEQTSVLDDETNGKFWKFAIFGNTKSGPYEELQISANNVYSISRKTTVWGKDTQETIWYLSPVDLKIEYLRQREEATTEIRFWLTPSIILTPLKMIETSYTGEVKVKVIESIKFELINGLKLDFQTHFKTREDVDGDHVTSQHLVGASNFYDDPEASTKVNSTILNELDDFLLISSFAARQRCVCAGWEAFDSRGHTKFYRRDIIIPENDGEHGVFDGVIHPEYFQEFLQVGYKKFIDGPLKNLLRDVIRSVMPREDSTIEANFTRFFSAIETLVLIFRRQNNLEYIFSGETEWAEIDKALRAWLKEQPLLAGKENSEKRSLVYENLTGLQRISFSYAFKKFCDFYKVDLSDLWAISGGGSQNWSLTMIRNKIVHGDEFSDFRSGALITAMQHLQWTLERMILGFIGWDISKSLVNKEYLSQTFNDYKDLERDRQLLSSLNSQ